MSYCHCELLSHFGSELCATHCKEGGHGHCTDKECDLPSYEGIETCLNHCELDILHCLYPWCGQMSHVKGGACRDHIGALLCMSCESPAICNIFACAKHCICGNHWHCMDKDCDSPSDGMSTCIMHRS